MEGVAEDLRQDPPSAFIWIDDEEVNKHGDFVRQAFELPALVIGPDPDHGITPDDLAAMRTFLESLG